MSLLNNDPPLSSKQRLHKLIHTTYSSLISELSYFLHNSLDGDVIEFFQNKHYHTEGESELSLRGIISNKVEDHVKIVGYILSYKSAIIIQYLENVYAPYPQELTDGITAEVSSRLGLFLMKQGAFAYSTLQMAEHYSWMNEISDTLSDIVTETVFGEN